MRLEELDPSAIDYLMENMDDSKLGKWEKSFFYSVKDQWERNRKLSDKQKEKLGEIWDN